MGFVSASAIGAMFVAAAIAQRPHLGPSLGADGALLLDPRWQRVVERADLELLAKPIAPELALSVARRETETVSAGVALALTPLMEADRDGEALRSVNLVLARDFAEDRFLDDGLAPITPTAEILARKRKTRAAETYVVATEQMAAALTVTPGVADSEEALGIGEPAGATEAIEVPLGTSLALLASEAFERHGHIGLAALSANQYFSLSVMRERVGAMSLLSDKAPGDATHWAMPFTDDDLWALNREGLGLGAELKGGAAGFDYAVTRLAGEGSSLIFGGFGSAFSLAAPEHLVSFAHTGLPRVQGAMVGLYGVYDSGPWTVSGVLRAEMAQTQDFVADDRLGFSTVLQSLKAEVTARYRKDFDGWFLEPMAGLTYETVRLGTQAPAGPEMRFEDTESLAAKIGVRAGGIVYNRGDVSVEPSVTISLSQEFLGNGNVTFVSGAPTGALIAKPGSTVGEVSVNVDVIDAGLGLRGFVKADGRITDDAKGEVGVSAGVKTKF